ncbi:hypothetical protein [Priestia megaterium]|nr:hypothetical protein [Priestia megaterium]
MNEKEMSLDQIKYIEAKISLYDSLTRELDCYEILEVLDEE